MTDTTYATLHTQEFLDSYEALHNAKYPTLNTNKHLVLSTILTVAVEWDKRVNEIQELLDKKTREQNLELQFFQEAKARM